MSRGKKYSAVPRMEDGVTAEEVTHDGDYDPELNEHRSSRRPLYAAGVAASDDGMDGGVDGLEVVSLELQELGRRSGHDGMSGNGGTTTPGTREDSCTSTISSIAAEDETAALVHHHHHRSHSRSRSHSHGRKSSLPHVHTHDPDADDDFHNHAYNPSSSSASADTSSAIPSAPHPVPPVPSAPPPSSSPTLNGIRLLDCGPVPTGFISLTLARLGGNGPPTLPVQLHASLENDTLGGLARRAFSEEIAQLPEPVGTRIFFLGRILNSELHIKDAPGIASGNVIHVLLTPGAQSAATTQNGDQASASQEGDSSQDIDLIHPQHAGLTEYELEQLRALEAMDFDEDGADGGRTGSGSQRHRSHFMMSSAAAHTHPSVVGSNGELVIGFLLGFILGFISLLWLYNTHTSRKQRLGILLGLLANIGMGMIQWSEEGQNTPPTLDPISQIADGGGGGGGVDRTPSAGEINDGGAAAMRDPALVAGPIRES